MTVPADRPRVLDDWGGEMGRLVRATDWSHTPLGPIDQWPASLSTAVSLILGSRFPMVLLWGRELVQIYNDGYIPIAGVKHPAALGARNIDCWPEVAAFNGPILDRVFRGEAVYLEDQEYVLNRGGAPESVYLTVSYSPVRDEAGAVGGAFVALFETTKRIRAERENRHLLERSQTRVSELRRLFQQAPGFIAVLRGPRHVFELVNDTYYQLIGHRDVIGKSVREALPELEGQGFFELLDKVYATGEAFVGKSARVFVQRQAGAPPEESFLDFIYQPVIEEDGTVSDILVQGNEVTPQVRAAEALERSDRFKDQFIAVLSHELRNPLAPIANAVHILRMVQLPAEAVKPVDIIERQARQLHRLVNDLLDISRISAGKFELHRQPALLGDVVATALEQVRPLVLSGGHRLHLQLPQQPIRLDADPVRLSQVISNLLNNAAKYTPRGGNIWLDAARDGGGIVIRVRDDGTGMAREFLSQAFSFFTQETANGAAHGGLGLGLALVKTLVELHGGQVSVASAGRNQGTEVIVSLPASA